MLVYLYTLTSYLLATILAHTTSRLQVTQNLYVWPSTGHWLPVHMSGWPKPCVRRGALPTHVGLLSSIDISDLYTDVTLLKNLVCQIPWVNISNLQARGPEHGWNFYIWKNAACIIRETRYVCKKTLKPLQLDAGCAAWTLKISHLVPSPYLPCLVVSSPVSWWLGLLFN